jgi:phytoene dehydrogenase-like protein
VDPDVLIIGTGHNGLVAAFYLARAGLNVEMVEARALIGGACVTEELIPGFKFSTCANVACWLRPKVVDDMQLLERGLQFSVTNDEKVAHCWPVVTQVLPDKQPFVWWPDPKKMQAEIARFSQADAEAWLRWNDFWDKAGNLIGPYLLAPPPTLAELMGRARQTGVEDVLTIVLTTSLAQLADRFFESEVMRNHVHAPHDVGSVYDTGTGLATALAAAMSGYTETGQSAPGGYVRGGMGNITQTMAQAAREHGVTIRANSPVHRILVEDGRAVGVELEDGQRIAAKNIVSNADPKRTFLKLTDPADLSKAFLERVRQLRTDIAPLKFHCALSELPEYYAFEGSDLPTRGSFLICPDRAYHEQAWDDARHRRLPQAPYMELMTPSVWDDSLAPPGKHTVSFWILFAPVHLKEGSWPERRDEMAERLLHLMDHYSPNFRRAVVDYVLLTPYDLEQRVLLTDGNIHHVDISPSQMLWQRPLPELAHYQTPVQNLYMCGAGMHPYGEVSGAPGHNAAHIILHDLSVRQ